jgi:cytochrome b6-f complex iron-sulfur subunit
MNRRDLIQRVLVGGTVLVLVPSILQNCTKDPATDPVPNPNNNPGGGNTTGTKIDLDLTLADNSVLNTNGGSKVVQNILIINTGIGFNALSSICTHEGCTVGYNSVSGKVVCPCHGSVFTTAGGVVNGPAASSLQSFPATKTGNILTIQL